MNLSSYVHKFFIFAGLLLVAIAAVHILTRRREKPGRPGRLPLDATTVRAFVFLVVGILVTLAGFGILPLPGDR